MKLRIEEWNKFYVSLHYSVAATPLLYFSIRCSFQPSPRLISNRTVLDSMYCCWSAALRSRGDREGYGMGVVFRDHQK